MGSAQPPTTPATDDGFLRMPREPVTPSSFTRPYWEATRDRRLVIQYSEQMNGYQFFPMPISRQGVRRDAVWREVEPVGQLFAYTITRRGVGPFRGHEPYVVATVTLDAGVRIVTNLVDCPFEHIAIGMRVAGVWHPLPDGTHLLMFRPARDVERSTGGGNGNR